jgi:hypothetical protein
LRLLQPRHRAAQNKEGKSPFVAVDDPSLGKEVNGLKAELTLSKQNFLLGEEIAALLRIRNVSDHDIKLWEHRDRIYGYTFHTRFVVQLPDGRRVSLEDLPQTCRAMQESSFPDAVVLPSKKNYDFDATINHWINSESNLLDQFKFPPGKYTVYAEYFPSLAGTDVWLGTLRSNAVSFTVSGKPFQKKP